MGVATYVAGDFEQVIEAIASGMKDLMGFKYFNVRELTTTCRKTQSRTYDHQGDTT